MDNAQIERYFLNIVNNDNNMSYGIAAIKTLLMVLEKTTFVTIQELINTIKSAIKVIKESGKPITSISSSCELFMCFITISSPKIDEMYDMEEVKKIMTNRGQSFLRKLLASREVIAKNSVDFITDGCRILTIGRSRVVYEALKLAASKNKHFRVYVTMSMSSFKNENEGEMMVQDLKQLNIDASLVLDAAIGYTMESIDFVFSGAEGVMENGGIINRIGTFTAALCASEMNKPFYVLTESFKFSRIYPLNQRDIPSTYKFIQNRNGEKANIHPLVDFTPPLFITLIFTDLGILTPSAVSDELIKLY
ncbi:hypothetical protein PVAND_001978 [Polypedilum vanderplanki]|uniref:Translation initiation factor eIF2B subunit alpha n=1 Tax=Polypedilum vanderplanki TaxID=319348 RepID=A0A9J6BQU5_POLVA|nr:hypothetical protein PVAND_001978 [Polypedilum vanderplanki]